ncbi:MAG: histidine phosphatase family protein [Phenylobacterium sp.]|uniref:SixA phosphatase family protein n=1 Tax=Phenylobacterium sp. TaxID=1871053 RepID=UPI00273677AD|nr:histidine phosphatase family protein [Phenylobacterium sp.]MDP1643757.1 histidine phosphatase family protein [Phenylobacterium sp.]MDP3115904.1 histidine phosphatase family protein [Phenylobacterium sp.]MDP3384320.1 histidine phosphatase family protein [Phenylobacterium sp.]
MQRLILLRHGKAERESMSGDDHARRLTPRGRRDALEAGQRLVDMGFVPDLALVSDAARTRETWESLRPVCEACQVRIDPSLYHAEAQTVLDRVREAADGAETVLVIGHNPGLHELVLRLLIEGGASGDLLNTARSRFPTSAAAVFLFNGQGRPVYDGLMMPPRGGHD